MGIKSDVKEIKSDVKKMLQDQAVHSQILAEHKQYSIALQGEQKEHRARLETLEKHDAIWTKAAGVLCAILTGALIQWLVHSLTH